MTFADGDSPVLEVKVTDFNRSEHLDKVVSPRFDIKRKDHSPLLRNDSMAASEAAPMIPSSKTSEPSSGEARSSNRQRRAGARVTRKMKPK